MLDRWQLHRQNQVLNNLQHVLLTLVMHVVARQGSERSARGKDCLLPKLLLVGRSDLTCLAKGAPKLLRAAARTRK